MSKATDVWIWTNTGFHNALCRQEAEKSAVATEKVDKRTAAADLKERKRKYTEWKSGEKAFRKRQRFSDLAGWNAEKARYKREGIKPLPKCSYAPVAADTPERLRILKPKKGTKKQSAAAIVAEVTESNSDNELTGSEGSEESSDELESEASD